MDGYLHKKGRGRTLSFVKPWSYRYFKLNMNTGTLRYYTGKIEDSSLRGELVVSNCTACPISRDITGRPFSFELSGFRSDDTEESSLILAASSDEERDAWMTAINNLISQRNSDTAALTDIEVHDIRLETADQCVHPIPTPVQLDISDTANEAVPSIQSHDPCAPVDESAVLPMSLVSRSPPIASSGSFYSFAEEEGNPSIGLETAAAQMRARFAHLHVSAEDFALDRDAAPSGIGGYGVVHKATRIRDGKICALKFFGYAKRDPASISVWDEIDVMNKLQQCPAMVKLEGYFEDTREGLLPGKKFPGSFPVIVMEFVEHDLLTFLSTNATAQDVLPTVFRDLISGLAFIHTCGYVHRDLKVDNVMINAERKVKLIDFGLLVALPEGKSDYQGSQAGTIGYFAPESIPLSGKSKFSALTDVWQAGVVLYVLLSGSLPFNISSVNIRKGKYAPLSGSQWEKRSEECKDLVKRMLVVNPLQRITCAEILTHAWLAPSAPKEVFDREYYQRIASLAVRRNIKRMLEDMREGAEEDGQFDRKARASSIMRRVRLTSEMMYFQLRTGALKCWLLQRLTGDYTYHSAISYVEFVSMMGEHQLPEMQNEVIYRRFVDDELTSLEECRVTVKELLLTLIALCQMEDDSDDAFITFLKFDLNKDGFISKDEMELLFRSILEEEALECMVAAEGPPDEDGETKGLVDIESEMVAIEEVLRAISVKNEKGIDFSEFKNFFDMAMKISNNMSMRLSMNMSVRVSMKFMHAAKSARIAVATRPKPETRKQLSA